MRGTRTFIALPLPAGLVNTCMAWIRELKAKGIDARWVTEEELHITLTFLGELKTPEVIETCRLTTRIAAGSDGFVLGMEGIGFFPSPKKPRILWAGLDRGLRETIAFQKHHTTNAITQYNTYLNQVPILTNQDIDISKNQHYLYNKRYIEGSAIQSGVSYSNQFTHIDNFTGMPLHEFAENTTILNGISLAENQNWSLTATTTLAKQNYVFWVCQKQLTISSAGIQVM